MIQIQIATQTQIATQIQTAIQTQIVTQIRTAIQIQIATQDSDSDAGKHTPVKPMHTTKDHHNKAKALPETGNENSGSNNATLFGGLFAALGSLLLFSRS